MARDVAVEPRDALAFLGGLSFTPADVTVDVGDTVAWTNPGTFPTRPGTPWEIRARLRDVAAVERATDWSPPAPVTG